MEEELLTARCSRGWICLVSLILFLGWSSDLVRAQVRTTNTNTDSVLDQRVDVFAASNEELPELLARISNSYKIPVGFEEAKAKLSQTETRKLSFEMQKTTINAILDRICTLDRRYSWKYEKGVIVVQPTNGNQNRLIRGFLSTTIGHFALGEKDTLYSTRTKIASTPEIVNYLGTIGVRSDLEFLGSLTTRLGLKSELIFRNKSVYLILNELAKSTVRFWSVSRTSDGIYVSIS